MNTGTAPIMREAVLQDMPYFYEICLKTAGNGSDGTELFSNPYLVGAYYAAPYLCWPFSICFVLDVCGIPKGYLAAVPDTGLYEHWLETSWLPPLRRRHILQRSYRSEAERALIETIHRTHANSASLPVWREHYPAHLHIDLLPCVQGAGWGQKLITQLCTCLAARGVGGVHLGVGKTNTAACAFYHKAGFTVLEEEPWGFVMGKLTGQV